ncbi:MAG: tRNA (cytidine(56)-2'-O)-methyltransferase [Crenarchaeota archaeon]|nr:tRNA (cytidine(56)-2'-O)-methyltransferase [Thermoproteota archaeon]
MQSCISIEQLTPPDVYVLRLGHRPERDKRITTHVALVARAFGAKGIYVADVVDEHVARSITKVVETWGGSYFKIEMGVNPRKLVKKWKMEGGAVVHLTMYGLPVDDVVSKVRSYEKVLVVVGAEKVPRWVYDEATLNVAIGNQPHSEVSALAIFLDRLWGGRELNLCFPDAKMYIVPSERGKKVVTR